VIVALACSVAVPSLAVPWTAWAQAPKPTPAQAPRDPNTLPRMRAPGGQPQLMDRRWDPDFAASFSSARRLALTFQPVFASFRLPFRGRPVEPYRGGGGALELDVHIWQPFWLRFSGAYTAHPMPAEFSTADDGEITQTAMEGTLHAGSVGVGAVYGLDLGRVLPMLEVGLGGLWIRAPGEDQGGQRGGACLDNGICDVGLVCTVDNLCAQESLVQVHAGIDVDIMLGHHWAVGLGLRYFALLTEPSVFPVYLHARARLGVRF
jgi:hypothetical protein